VLDVVDSVVLLLQRTNFFLLVVEFRPQHTNLFFHGEEFTFQLFIFQPQLNVVQLSVCPTFVFDAHRWRRLASSGVHGAAGLRVVVGHLLRGWVVERRWPGVVMISPFETLGKI
jgi:hypothetical protein